MKFKLDMDEIGNLIRTHVETQYGRKTGKMMFNVEGRKLDVEVDDIGPMPKDAPAPDLKAEEEENVMNDLGKRD